MKKLLPLSLAAALLGAFPVQSQAQTALYWDADGAAGIGGTGAWDTTSTLWNTASSGAANTIWNNATSTFANFGGTAGTVTVDAGGVTTRGVNASNNGALGFDTGGYSLTGGTITVLSTVADANVVIVRGGTTTSIANNIAITPFAGGGTTGDFIRLVHQRVNNSHVTFDGNIGMAAGVTSGVQRLDFIAGGGATNTQSTLNGVVSNYLGAGTGGTLQIRVGVNGSGPSDPIVNLNGNNTFTSGVIVGDGIVNVGHTNALGTAAFAFGTGGIGAGSVGQLLTSSALTISNAIGVSNQANQAGAIIGVGGAHSSTFSGTITNDGAANLATATTLRAASGGTATFSGLITDGAATKNVVKDGLGTVILSRAAGNTYDGTTTVSAGTLLVNNTTVSGTGTGSVSVSAGANLGGTGIISGATTVLGNLNAGNGGSTTETLAFGSTLDLASAQTITFNLAGTTRSSGYDGIDVTGALTNGGALVANFGSSFLVGGETFDLFALSGDQSGDFGSVSIAGSYSATLTNTLGVWAGTDGDFNYSYTQSTGDLAVTAVPEPSTLALLALSLTAVALRRRRA